MLCYFCSTNVEHRSFDNLKKFLHSEYTRSCEKFKRSEPQAQKENVISEEYIKSLDDEIRRLKERISRRKADIAATRQYTDAIPSDDDTISSVILDEQKPSNSEIIESISKAESMIPSSFDYGYMAKSPVRTKSKGCTTKVSKEIHRANVSPRNQDSKGPTKDNGVGMSPTDRVGEPPKGTVSENCIKGSSSNV